MLCPPKPSVFWLSLSFFAAIVIGGCKKAAPPSAPPQVQVATIRPATVPIFEEWIGTLDGFVNAQIRAQVTGYLLTQNYTEGGRVKKGDLLFQIDPGPFQAVLDQAQAKLAQDQAHLGKTEQDVKRYAPLAKAEAISQQELDDAIQADLAAQAQIKADQAALETARLNLGFTRVISPVDGLAGIATAQVGDLVSASSGPLTTVSQLDPIKVYFQVSEQSYLTFWQRLVSSQDSAQSLPLQLILSDRSTYSKPGKFFFADRQVNPNTGTLQVVGIFPNQDYLLRPGQYGRVRAQTEVKSNALLVPQRAVTELQGSYQVSVVDDENKVHLRPVKIGEQTGADWIIESGLKPGERIVVEGLQQAKEGVIVAPQPFTPAKEEAAVAR